MGATCSSMNKVNITVSEPTVISRSPKRAFYSTEEKEYPVIATNARGLRQLAKNNRDLEMEKEIRCNKEIDIPNTISVIYNKDVQKSIQDSQYPM